MTKSTKQNSPETTTDSSKIQTLIFGRLALTFLIVVVSWLWVNYYTDLPIDSFPGRLFWVFFLTIGLTLLYFLIARFNKNFLWQVRFQFAVDLFLITVVCFETGNLNSPFVTLYIILVAVSGIFFAKRETLIFAVVSTASFATLIFFSNETLSRSFINDELTTKELQILAFNSISILIVGLLAAHLSERRKIKEKLKSIEESFEDLNVLHEIIIESIRSGLITTDLGGKIRNFNRAAQDISGIRTQEIIGDSVYTLFGDDIRSAVDISLLRAAENNEFPTEHFESIMSIPGKTNGSANSTEVACSVAPLIAKTGMVNGLILTFQDLSEIRSMEKSLRQGDRLAAVGRMAAGLAHEIRNPLGSMSSALQFLEENVKATGPESELLAVVQREADRLNNIITNFLTYSRLSVGTSERNLSETMDINAAISDCLVLFRHSPEIEETHILKSDLPNKPVFVSGSETQIKQVLWNLIQNAIQSMPTGGTLDVRLKDFPGKSVRITLEDSGCGISSEISERLLEPFVSGSSGAGLGLSIVHTIIQDHGGKLDIESKEKEGTRVTVELPY